jgi:hypothetical protein
VADFLVGDDKEGAVLAQFGFAGDEQRAGRWVILSCGREVPGCRLDTPVCREDSRDDPQPIYERPDP